MNIEPGVSSTRLESGISDHLARGRVEYSPRIVVRAVQAFNNDKKWLGMS